MRLSLNGTLRVWGLVVGFHTTLIDLQVFQGPPWSQMAWLPGPNPTSARAVQTQLLWVLLKWSSEERLLFEERVLLLSNELENHCPR